jgi:hypothetical protein
MGYKSLESVIRNKTKTEGTYISFRSAIKSIFVQISKVETHEKDQIVVGAYRTSHFEMCPKAQLLYADLPEKTVLPAAERTAQILDQLFALEKSVISTEKATGEDIKQAKDYADKAMEMARRANLTDEHKFVADHVKKIESYHKVEGPPKEKVDPEEVKKKFSRPSLSQTPEPKDMDIDNQKFKVSRNLKAQRKLKIIDND